MRANAPLTTTARRRNKATATVSTLRSPTTHVGCRLHTIHKRYTFLLSPTIDTCHATQRIPHLASRSAEQNRRRLVGRRSGFYVVMLERNQDIPPPDNGPRSSPGRYRTRPPSGSASHAGPISISHLERSQY